MRIFFFYFLTFSAFVACKQSPSKSANVKLDEGIVDTDGSHFPAVYGIATGAPSSLPSGELYGAPICTGTAVSDTVILTAAHCFLGSSKGQKYWLVEQGMLALVDKSGKILEGTATVNSMSLIDASTLADNKAGFVADLAVLTFPQAKFAKKLAIAETSVHASDDVTIVGFGYDSVRNVVSRQYGATKVVAVVDSKTMDPFGKLVFSFYESMIWTQFNRELNSGGIINSGTVSGDSGGPMIFKDKIVGVLYGGAYWHKDRSPGDQLKYKDSIYVNIQHPSNQAFLKKKNLLP